MDIGKMKTHMYSKESRLARPARLAVWTAVLGLALPLSAQNIKPETVIPKANGLYLSLIAHRTNFGMDLDTAPTLWHFEKAFFVPHFRPALSLGLGLGGKSIGGSWEVAYSLALPLAAVRERDQTVQLHNFSIKGRTFFGRHQVHHPYLTLGVDIPILIVPRGAHFEGRELDAAYAGGGLNAGLGWIIDLDSSVFLDIAYEYRFSIFLYAYGEGKGRDINFLTVGPGGPAFGRLLRTSSMGIFVRLGLIL
jgi:hypothetical protein